MNILLSSDRRSQPWLARARGGRPASRTSVLGWHFLSDATCLIRPHLFCARFVVSRITPICYMIHHF